MNLDPFINDFAIRSFRDTADEDYIAARMCWRAQLIPPFLCLVFRLWRSISSACQC